MGPASIDGKSAALASAVEEAARLLSASRLPVIAGLGTDVAGARAAIGLAARLGGVVDHIHSDALLRDLDVMRQSGVMLTSPSEARLRADVVLVVGACPAWRNQLDLLFSAPLAPETDVNAPRRILWLGAARRRADASAGDAEIQHLGGDAQKLPGLVAAIRACVAGRNFADAALPAKRLHAIAADLKSARFGVAVWSAGELDAPTIEMLCGLVADLNAHTRFTGLPSTAGDHGWGVLQVCGWMTGFPIRTGFGRIYPEHDPWCFDANRLVESQEADCAVWISALSAAVPPWRRQVNTIALTGHDARFPRPPKVHFVVGRPGVGHDAVQWLATTGSFAWTAATNKRDTLSVADVIGQISAQLAYTRTPPC